MGGEIEVDERISNGNHLSFSFGMGDCGSTQQQCERYQEDQNG
jgi:hypothetical protein